MPRFHAFYPVKSGDYDEFVIDKICVQVEGTGRVDDPIPLDLLSDWESARFPSGDRRGAAEWLVSNGCPREEAARLVDAAIDRKTSVQIEV
jgi:hypothetical protein